MVLLIVYPFSATYKVAAPVVAVEAEKMNVFYIGVVNPIAVSAAAGISPTDLISECYRWWLYKNWWCWWQIRI